MNENKEVISKGNVPVIRAYRDSDKESVRKICSDTADLGKPVENFFYDREIFADMVISYYTDFEPGSLWVAQDGQRVVGYLSGCLDTARYIRILLLKIIPKVLFRAIKSGALWHKDTVCLVKSAFKSIRLGGLNRKDISTLYPAHLHINLEDDYRHKGFGKVLVEKFIDQARLARKSGVHASTSFDNQPARNFFERMGFSMIGKYPMSRPGRCEDKGTTYSLVYGRRL